MEEFITTSNITFIIGVLAFLFSIFIYFKTPQEKSQTNDAVFEERMKNLQETNERRFKGIHDEIIEVNKTNQNCFHSVENKVDVLRNEVGSMNVSIGKLETIINERIPKK
jgi:hypothetical protein